MFRVHTVGHANSGGGIITNVLQDFVTIDGMLVSVDGSIGTGHRPCPEEQAHCAGKWKTANGSDFVTINGIPVNYEGNSDTCGHVRVGGSDFVFIVP